MRKQYKETPIGKIPYDWEALRIGDSAVFVGSGITPKGGKSVYKECGIPFIRSQNVYNSGLRLDDIAFIDIEQHEKMKRTEVNAGDVLLNITGASIGRCTYVPDDFDVGNVNQHVCIIRMDENTDSCYLASVLGSTIGRNQIDSFNGGSSREGLNFQQVRSIQYPVPPLPEQKKIAKILSTVDGHIDEVDGMIEDLKELKKGLMQKLLTEGIGHTEFKDSEVGRIPVEWEVKALGEVFKLASGKFLPAKEMIDGEFDVFGGNGISGFHNEFLFEDSKLVIGRVGAKCGCVHMTSPKSWITDNALYVSEDLLDFDMNFMYNLLTWIDLNKYASQNAQPVISGKKIYSIKVAMPNIGEQKRISEVFSSMESRIEGYCGKLEDLHKLKKGLMQQLLTGKVRVC